jgi:hypothetical protein
MKFVGKLAVALTALCVGRAVAAPVIKVCVFLPATSHSTLTDISIAEILVTQETSSSRKTTQSMPLIQRP